MAIGTGHGATISVGGEAVAAVRGITGHSEDQGLVDASHLGTIGPSRDYVPADLADAEPMVFEALFDTEQAGGLLDLDKTAVQVVLTFKKTGGATGTPANLTGNGFLMRRTWPSHLTNEVMVAEYALQWAAQPVFTAETTT